MQAVEQATFGSLNPLWGSHTETAGSDGNFSTIDFNIYDIKTSVI
jgi:hypothetical protein